MGNVVKPIYFRDHIRKVATTTTHDLNFAEIKSGWLFKVTGVSFKNDTSADTRVDLLIKGGGQEHFEDSKLSTAAAVTYKLENNFYLTELEILTGRWIDCAANDVLWLFRQGIAYAPNNWP